MHSYIRPNTYVALRLPSGIYKVLEITPNTNINIGKFGSFPANALLGRPYYLTFEIEGKEEGKSRTELRVVPARELHAETLAKDEPTPVETNDGLVVGDGAEFDIVGEDGEVVMRSNRLTIDDPSRQQLSMDEIEELKKAGTGSGKEIIAKIMASHKAIDEKTTFSLAKYTLRKSKKYLKRFTVFPLDVRMLTEYITEREHYKIMELREEMLGLISSWANIHCASSSKVLTADDGKSQIGGGRWLVVDDTGGLIVAALSEKMGILYPNGEEEDEDEEETSENGLKTTPQHQDESQRQRRQDNEDVAASEDTNAQTTNDTSNPELRPTEQSSNTAPVCNTSSSDSSNQLSKTQRPRHHSVIQSSSLTNTLTVVHTNNQPNLSLLRYFSYDHSSPTSSHPLFTHLKSLSWLQLLDPESTPEYEEPELIPDDVLLTMKSSKRGNYYKKRRRWEKARRLIDETRAGGFDGLVVASSMEPTTILRELVPLVRGSGKVVVYSNNVEPLVELCDFYSKERRAAYIDRFYESQKYEGYNGQNGKVKKEQREDEYDVNIDPDFPVNPTLLLAPMLQTARARQWQVLPERTHPMMTSRGGSEGFLFTATRVLPIEGKVEARGKFRAKRRKTGPDTAIET